MRVTGRSHDFERRSRRVCVYRERERDSVSL
jgi:hypothetical protein